MVHKFNPANMHKLEDPKRRELLPPDKTLLTLGVEAGMTVIDVGSGTGYFALPAAKIVGEKGFVYAVDIYQELLDYSKQKAEQESIKNMAFIKGEETVIPVKDDTADAVLMANVVHELLEPEKSFQEILRVLKPDGKLLLIEWKKQETEMGPPLHERLSVEEAEALVVRHGFNVSGKFDLGPTHYGLVALPS